MLLSHRRNRLLFHPECLDVTPADDDGSKEPKAKRAKPDVVFVDPKTKTKNDVTAFVANLATATDEAALQLFFAKVGV